jgi:hypothetical protein
LLWESTVKDWKASLTDMNSAAFSGDEFSINFLQKMIGDGNSLDREPASVLDIETYATKFLASILVPEVWRMQGYYPVLLDTAFPCDTEGIGWGQWTDRKKVGNTKMCWEGEGGIDRDAKSFDSFRQYQLWTVKDPWINSACNGPCTTCGVCNCKHYMTEPPGLGKLLEPVVAWGKISIYDIITKSVPKHFISEYFH